MPPVAIQTWNLTKRYGAVEALTDVNLEIPHGEIFGFLGPNGAGKTTAIRLLFGLMRPTEGRAHVLGYDVHREGPSARRSMSLLPSDNSLYPFMKVDQYLEAFGRITRASHRRQADLLERLELDPSRKIGDLSMGNRQKVAIIRALQDDVPVYVVDEPTRGLDPLIQQEFGRVIMELRNDGRTVLFSTHVLSEAEALCDRVGILRTGRLVQVDSVAELTAARLRHMTVTFAEVPPADLAIQGATEIHLQDNQVRFNVRGSIDQILKTLARYTVVDLSINEPSLEEIFLRHYGSEDRE
jgi:ABC-2 type transport system ATP-binding protein